MAFPNQGPSRTKQALARIAAGETVYSVAKEMGLQPSSLYRARRDAKRKAGATVLERCPTCGKIL